MAMGASPSHSLSFSESPATSERSVAMITGATGAIGEAVARGIARDQRYDVVLVCRDARKAAIVAARVSRASGNPAVRYEIVDISLMEAVRAFARRWTGPLHVLVNNAATAPRMRQTTLEGIELQFATNVLGYFWMTQEFSSVLAGSTPARVVNVASYWAGGLEIDDLEFQQRPYDNDAAYRQSKQANRMLTVAFAERFGTTIAVNACHPGDVNSTLSRQLGFGGHESPDDGARTPLMLALDRNINVTGRYFDHEQEKRCRFAADRNGIEALYSACERYSV